MTILINAAKGYDSVHPALLAMIGGDIDVIRPAPQPNPDGSHDVLLHVRAPHVLTVLQSLPSVTVLPGPNDPDPVSADVAKVFAHLSPLATDRPYHIAKKAHQHHDGGPWWHPDNWG